MNTCFTLMPLTVVGPMLGAAVLLALGRFAPKHLPDIVGIAISAGVAVLCGTLAFHAIQTGPQAYWFGDWLPHPEVTLGIGFRVDAVDASIAAFIAFLYAMTFIFAWSFFEQVRTQFHVIALLFLSAMMGFCLTRDLFNMFVWFEVMSVSGFALTAYKLEASSLAGALNFTVTNSIAGFMMLGGVHMVIGKPPVS